MSILGKIFGNAPPAGTHPDSAIRTRERGEARGYVTQRYVCPSCRKRGNKDIRGHAQVLRRLTSGQGRMYDVYNVFCGCGHFSSFWADSSSWLEQHVQMAETLCQPNGKCFWMVGSGQMPYIDPSLIDPHLLSRHP